MLSATGVHRSPTWPSARFGAPASAARRPRPLPAVQADSSGRRWKWSASHVEQSPCHAAVVSLLAAAARRARCSSSLTTCSGSTPPRATDPSRPAAWAPTPWPSYGHRDGETRSRCARACRAAPLGAGRGAGPPAHGGAAGEVSPAAAGRARGPKPSATRWGAGRDPVPPLSRPMFPARRALGAAVRRPAPGAVFAARAGRCPRPRAGHCWSPPPATPAPLTHSSLPWTSSGWCSAHWTPLRTRTLFRSSTGPSPGAIRSCARP